MKACWALLAASLHGLLGAAAALPQHPTDSTYENGESRPGKSLDGCADEISVAQAKQDFVAALSISGYAMSTFAGNVTDLATRLVNWNGCDTDHRRMIYAGWQQSWKIMNLLYKEANAIDFNEASALEYLGPPGLNQDQQGTIRDIFRNLATIQPGYIKTPLSWQIHVRCDDPSDKCTCGGGSRVDAYTTNRDPSSGLARINFCPIYFASMDLDVMMKHGGDKSKGEDWWANLDNYIPNKARTWIHELLHIDWVSKAGQYGSNRHITDLRLLVPTRPSKEEGISWKIVKAYGPALVKALSRWGDSEETGEWVVQNSDSLTLYAMARYVQKALGNIYPHLPAAPAPPKRVDTPSNEEDDVVIGDLFAFGDDGTATIINFAAVDALSWQADDSCGLDEDFTTDAAVTLGDGFAPASSFPSADLDQYDHWNPGPQNLGSQIAIAP